MESAEKPIQDLHARVNKSLKRMGHVASASPDDDLSLENVRDILGKTAVHIVNAPVENEGLAARVEIVKGSKVISFVRERMRRLKAA